MLGKTAGGLFWMFRYLERSENTARLVDAGFRISLTRAASADDEWSSILTTSGTHSAYLERHDNINRADVINFLLRDRTNPTSVMSVMEAARNNARLVRTAITREVWEAVNDSWMVLKDTLSDNIVETELPGILGVIRQQSALVRGALHGTMLRNDIFNFCRLGTFTERADNIARILDVKYYVLLPSVSHVGSSLDNVQWETILRSASAERAFSWLNDDATPKNIASFLILDKRLPRSLRFCYDNIVRNFGFIADEYGARVPCHDTADKIRARLADQTISDIFSSGLHEFIQDFIRSNNGLGQQIETDYRFYG